MLEDSKSSRDQFSQQPKNTIMNWVRRLSTFIGGNLILQLIGFATGILVIRVVSKDDYALYSIYIGLLFSMTSLSDAGIGSTLLAQGARWVENSSRLSALFKTGLIYRRRIGIFVSILSAFVLYFLFSKNGNDSFSTAVSVAFMLVTLLAIFRSGDCH